MRMPCRWSVDPYPCSENVPKPTAGERGQLPGNPIDDLIHRLGGPGRVAELSGRPKRLERQEDGPCLELQRVARGLGPEARLGNVDLRS